MMDPRPLLQESPPSPQETPSSSGSAPAHYEAPPSASSSPPSPLLHKSPPSPQETHSSSGSAPAQYEAPPSASSSPPSPLLHKSPPSPQETPSSSGSPPAQYEPPPSASSSPPPASAPNSAPNMPLPPPSPPLPSTRVSSSPASAPGPSPLLQSPCIKNEATGHGSTVTRSNEVQTAGATATGKRTDEPPAQDHTPFVPQSTASTTSSPPPASSGVAAARRSTFWRLALPTRNSTPPALPVTNPQPVRQGIFSRFKEWHKSCQEHLLPDGVIQVRIAVCGFAFYGILALLGNTWDLISEFSENNKVFVLFLIGFIWTAATVAIPLTMSARTRLVKALSQHATRLVLLGITLHMLFNISMMLPRNVWVTSKINLWSLAASIFLLVFAIIGHGVSWIESSVYGEVEEKPTEESGNNMASS